MSERLQISFHLKSKIVGLNLLGDRERQVCHRLRGNSCLAVHYGVHSLKIFARIVLGRNRAS